MADPVRLTSPTMTAQQRSAVEKYTRSAIDSSFVDPLSLPNAANDAAAASAGVEVGGFYRNGSVLMVRVS